MDFIKQKKLYFSYFFLSSSVSLHSAFRMIEWVWAYEIESSIFLPEMEFGIRSTQCSRALNCTSDWNIPFWVVWLRSDLQTHKIKIRMYWMMFGEGANNILSHHHNQTSYGYATFFYIHLERELDCFFSLIQIKTYMPILERWSVCTPRRKWLQCRILNDQTFFRRH